MIIHLHKPLAIHELGQRANQEDFIYPINGNASVEDRLFILCDGMGGHEHGEVASKSICLAMAVYLKAHLTSGNVVDDSHLLAALEEAYRKLDALDDGAERKMGTTLCLLYFHRGGAVAMHIGDSRIYHFRPSENRILYQSKDHSLVYDLYQSGEITYDEMRTSPQKNILTRAIQPGIDNRVKPSIVHITDIRPDDYFYICSDGMLEQMDNEELVGIICGSGTDGKKRSILIASTTDNKDNHSAWLIHVRDVVAEKGDDNNPNDEQTSSDNALNIKASISQQDVDIVKATSNGDLSLNGPTAKGNTTTKAILIGLIAIVVLILGYFVFHKSRNTVDNKQSIESAAESKVIPIEDGVKMKTISRPTKKSSTKERTRTENKDTAKFIKQKEDDHKSEMEGIKTIEGQENKDNKPDESV